MKGLFVTNVRVTSVLDLEALLPEFEIDSFCALMLNPPLSLLSDDLIGYLVEHVARISFLDEAFVKFITISLTGSSPAEPLARLSGSLTDKTLHNLSLADPAFTKFCQKYIFQTLNLGREEGTRSRISKKLAQVKRILDDQPSFANRVRKVQLFIEHRQNAWLFQNNNRNHPRRKDAVYAITFISILELLAKSPMLPHELHFSTGIYPIEDPVLVMGRLSQSFFSQSLTILHLAVCENVPLPLFLLCPRLKEVCLDRVGATDEDYDRYPDDQCSGRVSPALELFNYRGSHTVVKQMITPPPKFHTPVVLWSNLRVLKLSPHEREEMGLLRPILDAACTLEELYLTNVSADPGGWSIYDTMKQI